jgi:hypothetical protein
MPIRSSVRSFGAAASLGSRSTGSGSDRLADHEFLVAGRFFDRIVLDQQIEAVLPELLAKVYRAVSTVKSGRSRKCLASARTAPRATCARPTRSRDAHPARRRPSGRTARRSPSPREQALRILQNAPADRRELQSAGVRSLSSVPRSSSSAAIAVTRRLRGVHLPRSLAEAAAAREPGERFEEPVFIGILSAGPAAIRNCCHCLSKLLTRQRAVVRAYFLIAVAFPPPPNWKEVDRCHPSIQPQPPSRRRCVASSWRA